MKLGSESILLYSFLVPLTTISLSQEGRRYTRNYNATYFNRRQSKRFDWENCSDRQELTGLKRIIFEKTLDEEYDELKNTDVFSP